MKKKVIYLILILILGFVLIGCSEKTDEPIIENPTNQDKENVENDENNENVNLLAVDAYDLYLDKYPNTEVYKFEFDDDNDQFYFKAKGFDDNYIYQLKINYNDGSIIQDEKEAVNDDIKDSLVREDVERAQAIVSKALEEAKDKPQLDEWSLKVEDSRVLVEVEIDYENKDDTEITYDVKTGEIISEDD